MSWILGIDTSSIDLGIGLYRDAEPVASYSRFLKNSHAEHIQPAIALMLQSNGVAPESVSRIVVATGPGSFTGLRIGIGFIKGFCYGTDTPVLPVSSLQVLAHRGLPGPSIVAAIDARRDEVFWARFRADNGRVIRQTDDLLSPAEQFYSTLQNEDTIVTDTMGYGPSRVFNTLRDRPCHYPVEQYPLERGLICARVGSESLENKLLWTHAPAVLPNYMRAFTAPARKTRAT